MDSKFTKRFIHGVSSTSLGTISQVISGFICLMITARLISKEQFGNYVLMMVIVSMFGMLSSLFLDCVAITKMISGADDTTRNDLVNTSISCKLTVDLAICVLIYICSPVIGYFFHLYEVPLWPVYGAMLYMSGNINSLFVRILQGLHLYKAIAMSQVINGTLKILLTVFFMYGLHMGIEGVIFAMCSSYFFTLLYQVWVLPCRLVCKFDRGLFLSMSKFGFPLGLNNIMSFFFTKIDRFMLGSMLSPIHVAYYEIASKLPESGRTLYEAYQTVFFPSMSELCAKNNHADASKILNNSMRILSFFSLLATFIVYLYKNEIVVAIFSAKYLPSSPAVPVLMMVLSFDLVGNILGTTLVAFGQSDKPVKINIFAAVTTIVSNFIMIPYLGFMGAGYTCILSRVITNPLNVWYLTKLGVHVEVIQYLKPLLSFIICFILTLIVNHETIVAKILLIALFVLLNTMLSVITNDDIKFIRYGVKPSDS